MEYSRNLLVLLGVAVLFLVCFAQEEHECRGQPVNMNDKEKAVITDCLKEAKIDNIWKIPFEKLPCFGVCILTRKDLLTKEGKINHEKALKYIETHMKDKETQRLLINATDKCIKEHGDKVKIDKDPKCLAFMDVGQCVHDEFLEICTQEPTKPKPK